MQFVVNCEGKTPVEPQRAAGCVQSITIDRFGVICDVRREVGGIKGAFL